jgi:sugar phosphate isomerase/epimerase
VREVLALASHPACGLLVDAYHLVRSGDGLRAVEDVPPAEIAYVQYSDVPRSGLEPGQASDRLRPGVGAPPCGHGGSAGGRA